MSAYHEKYMGEDGPTDVLSLPDGRAAAAERRRRAAGRPARRHRACARRSPSRQAAEHGRTPHEEAEYLLVHGLLHLLGFDHADADEKAEMFGLKDKILAAWDSQRPDRSAGR